MCLVLFASKITLVTLVTSDLIFALCSKFSLQPVSRIFQSTNENHRKINVVQYILLPVSRNILDKTATMALFEYYRTTEASFLTSPIFAYAL